MHKIPDIHEVQTIILDTAKVFHNTCENNNIPYYMLYGTMLGARRHQGFIPWDDDMDFGVPFEYYDQLVKALKEKLPVPYNVITRYDKGGAVGGYLKIVNTNTLIKESNKVSEDENTGLFIDIFLLYNERAFKPSLRQFVIKILLMVQHFRFYRLTGKNIVKTIADKMAKFFFSWLKMPDLINVIERHLIPSGGGYFTTYASIYGKKDFIPLEYYGKPKLYQFESMELYGVENPDKYLTHLYGNYMQLPPEEKRKIHLQEAYIFNEEN
jgi:lipopolysaccharide cholinephosphotransferase